MIEQEAQRYLAEFKFSVIPISVATKKPLRKWIEYQQRLASETEFKWRNANVAIVTGEISGIVGLDFESVELARKFWHSQPNSRTPMVVRSPRGIHLYYRHPGVRVRNAQPVRDSDGSAYYDVRGDGGYLLAPPSAFGEKRYEWQTKCCKPCDLPMFQMRWRPDNERNETPEIANVSAYISRIFAVSGQGGSNATWRAVNRVKESGVDKATALLIMQGWNETNASPPWSANELLRKLNDA